MYNTNLTSLITPLWVTFVFLLAVSFACDMLGCSVELLDQCLTKKSVETSRDTILTPHSAVEVTTHIHILCSMYGTGSNCSPVPIKEYLPCEITLTTSTCTFLYKLGYN